MLVEGQGRIQDLKDVVAKLIKKEEPVSSARPRVLHKIRLRGSPHNLSMSPSRRNSPRRSRPTPKPIEVFHKCDSEPMIFPVTGEGDGGSRSFESDEGGWFCRVHTLNDLMLCNDDVSENVSSSPLCARIDTGYKKDSKVVISVMVEGSPGPIKTLVRLGATVDDTIKLVVQKYGEEGRTPRLERSSPSRFDLHLSYFSLESLNRAYAIGDVGSRSFYLRKLSKKVEDGHKFDMATSVYEHELGSSSTKLPSPHTHRVVFPPLIDLKMKKFARRVHKLLILLGCLHSR